MTNYFQMLCYTSEILPIQDYRAPPEAGIMQGAVHCHKNGNVILPQELAIQLGQFQMLPYCCTISPKNAHSHKKYATDSRQQ